MTKIRPKIFLDVDGVINAQAANYEYGLDPMGWRHLDQGIATTPEGNRYRITWAPEMIAELNKLDVDIVWTTTWTTGAETQIAPLVGLELPSRVLVPLNNEPVSFPSINWKLEAVVDDQTTAPGPAIWLDDELSIAQMDVAEPLGILSIRVDCTSGIRPEDIDRIKQYIAAAELASETYSEVYE